jgi:hypothetical protein
MVRNLVLVSSAACWFVYAAFAQTPTTLRNSFETPKVHFQKGNADAAFDVVAHANSDQGAHSGQRSEYIKLDARTGSYIHYVYPLGGKALLTEDLLGGLWVKSNRLGIRLAMRVVLPHERDTANIEQKMTVLVDCDKYQNVGRWQRLDLGSPTTAFRKQQPVIQAEINRNGGSTRTINFADAYVEALVLNVYAGPGPIEVWVDDLEVGPVFANAPSVAEARPDPRGNTKDTGPLAPGARRGMVEFSGNHLVVGGQRYFFRMIRHTDTPLRPLSSAGFNAILVQPNTPPEAVREATGYGMWIVPQLSSLADDGKLSTLDGLTQEIGWYSNIENTLFVHLGDTLIQEQAPLALKLTNSIRRADPGRILSGNVWDGLPQYSRNLNLVGVHRFPLMTTLELPKYREWLEKRRLLASPNAFMWTWIQTQLTDWQAQLLYGKPSHETFDEPIGPQPEQIRLLTYSALAAGMKGLGFWSDRFLADTHQGRDRLLTCALLNQELDMLEPILTQADDAPDWIDTSHKEVKAAVMRTSKSVLVLPMWQGKGAQFVPGQAAAARLSIVVPQVPQNMQAWEVTPGEVRSLKLERVVGGTKVTLPEFGLTASVVFTSDLDLIKRFQVKSHAQRQNAAQWTYDLALYQRDKVVRIQDQLEKLGYTIPDASQLLSDSQNRLNAAKTLWETHQFSEAYREAQRALRPLRILMRAQWYNAVKELDSPVSSPYAVSFYTLPRHWEFAYQIRNSRESGNVLPGGDFEVASDTKSEAWEIKETSLDGMELLASRVTDLQQPMEIKHGMPTSIDTPRQGRKCAMLQISPAKGKPAPEALERTVLSLKSPEVKLQAGAIVKISGWYRIPAPITASPDGALVYDSGGGEPFAIRTTEPTPWKQFSLFRRVPTSGTLSVTLALSGIGAVYFDDIQIHPLTPISGEVMQTSGQK